MTRSPASETLGPITHSQLVALTAPNRPRWTLHQPTGGVFLWTTAHRQTYRVTRDGTDDLHHWSPAERLIRWSLDARPPPS